MDLKHAANRSENDYGRVLLAPFNPTQVAHINTGTVRQLLLSHGSQFPKPAYVRPDYLFPAHARMGLDNDG